MSPLVLSLPGNESLARTLARLLECEMGELELRQFPDGESHVRLASDPAARPVVVVCTFDRPDAKILPALFTADAARDLGATTVGILSPYLAYMRQDKRFQPGEAVTVASFARLLSSWFDWLVTVDPHLHRLDSLDAVYSVPAIAVQAAPSIARWIRDRIDRPLLVGPDSESDQWAGTVAREAGAPHVVLEKVRHGDRDVDISAPQLERWRDRTPVLVDDIVSTARTMAESVRHLRRAGLPAPVCVGVHAVLAGDAERVLREAGAADIVTCNTIAHATNRIDVGPSIAEAVRAQLSAQVRK